MRPVRSLLLALAVVALASPLAAEPAWAQAAEPIADAGLIEFLPSGTVIGDGATVTRLYAIAIGPTGAPVTTLSPKVEADRGSIVASTHLGNGVYAFDYQAPSVTDRTPVSLTLKARPASGKVERTLAFDVVPPTATAVTVAATPADLVLGNDLSSEVKFTLVGPSGQPLDGADVIVRASDGEVKALKAEAGGVFGARYTPRPVNFPHLALITAADARRPDSVYGFAVMRLSGKVEYPVTAPSGAQVTMTIAGRAFGPVTVGASGRAVVPIEVPPGVQKATVTTTPAGGAAADVEIDLGIPATKRVALFPTPAAVPGDQGTTIALRALVRTPSGEPDTAATVVFEVTRGTAGVPRHVGDGVYEVEYGPAAEPGPVDLTVRLEGEAVQIDAMTFQLHPAVPGRLVVTPDPPVLGSGATALSIVASPQAADGTPQPGTKLVFVGGGAKVDGDLEVGADGTTRARFLTNPAGPIEILVRPEVPPGGNPIRHLVLLPGRDRLTNDGRSGTPIVVVATDAWGQPVPGVAVSLDVVGADGQITPAVTTDTNGTGLVLYTAGRKASVAGIRARSGNFHAAAAVLQVPPDVPPFAMPRLGGPDQVAIATKWASATSLVRVEHGGDVTAGWVDAAPVPEPAVVPEPVQEPKDGPEEPWLRLRAGFVIATYQYQQTPNGDGGRLLDDIFAIGGPVGGKNATPMGFEADGRAWLPMFPYVGAQVHYRAAYYGITASIFGDSVAHDALHDFRVGLIGRYFFDFADTRLHAGARAGFHLNDLIYFSEQPNTDPQQYRYDTLIVPSLALGAEIGADVGKFYGVVGFDRELAYGSGAYAWTGDLTVGYDITNNLTVDLGVETMQREMNLVGDPSEALLGTVTDGTWLARAGLGLAF